MLATVEFSDAGDYLVIRVEDINTFKRAVDVITAAFDAARHSKPQYRKGLLFDVRNHPNPLSVMDIYDLAYHTVPRIANFRDYRCAILADVGDKTFDFAEMVAFNAGITVQKFSDEEAAIKWLRAEPINRYGNISKLGFWPLARVAGIAESVQN